MYVSSICHIYEIHHHHHHNNNTYIYEIDRGFSLSSSSFISLSFHPKQAFHVLDDDRKPKIQKSNPKRNGRIHFEKRKNRKTEQLIHMVRLCIIIIINQSINHDDTDVKRRKSRDAILTNKRFKCSKSFPMQWHVVPLSTIKEVHHVEGSRRFSIMFGQPSGAKPRSSSSFGNVLRRKSSRDSSEPQVMYFQTSNSSQSSEWVRLICETRKQLLTPQMLTKRFDEEMRSLTNMYSESPIIMASSSDDEEEEDDKTKESTDLVDEDMHVPLPQVKKLNIKNLNIDDDMDQDEYVVCVCVLENVIEKSHTHP